MPNVILSNVQNYIDLFVALNVFPGLGKYREQINGNVEQAYILSGSGDNYLLKLMQGGEKIDTASDANARYLNPEDDNVKLVTDSLKESKELTETMLADKDLVEKEPFLVSCLKVYDTLVSRGLSDGYGANLHMEDKSTAFIFLLINRFTEKIPSAQDLEAIREKSPEAYAAGMKVMDLFNAYAECYALSDGNEDEPDHIASIKREDEKLKKLEKAFEELKNIEKDSLTEFFKEGGKKSPEQDSKGLESELEIELRTRRRALKELSGEERARKIQSLRDKAANDRQIREERRIEEAGSFVEDYHSEDHRYSAEAFIADIEARRQQLRGYMSREEAMVLTAYVAEVGGAIKDMGSHGMDFNKLPAPYNEDVKRIKDLTDSCKKKLKDGFASPEEKEEFFEELVSESKEYSGKTNMLKYLVQDKSGYSKEQIRAVRAYMEPLAEYIDTKHSAVNKAEQLVKQRKLLEKARDEIFIHNMGKMYEMMEETKEGYLFHTNSREYKNMMDCLKIVKDLGGRKELSEQQKNKLTENYGKISELCGKYLNEDKLKNKQSSDTGKDRFAGALGILKLVDPEKADALKKTAEEKRRKKIKWDDLKKRVDDSEQKRVDRERKEKAKTQTSHKKKEIKAPM